MKKHLLIGLALLGLLASSLRATDYVFENFDTTLFKSGGQPWAGGVVNVEVGTFINGFTPTAGNLGSWLANWKADTGGFYDPSGPEWSSSLVLADNSVFKQNAQLYVWAFDSHTGVSAESALFKDAAWKVVANSPLDLNTNFLSFSAATSAVLGTFDAGLHTARTAAAGSSASPVPEPSAYGFFALLMLCSLAGYRRFRPAERI